MPLFQVPILVLPYTRVMLDVDTEDPETAMNFAGNYIKACKETAVNDLTTDIARMIKDRGAVVTGPPQVRQSDEKAYPNVFPRLA